MGYKTEELLERSPFDYSGEKGQKGGLFYDALMEELCFHYDNNEKYHKFCENKNFNPHDFSGDLAEIPSVRVSVFKELGSELGSVPTSDIKLTLQSSATSGTPSSVVVDKITSKRQTKAMVKVVGDFIGNERRPFLVMDVDPAEGFREILGARYAAVSGYLNFASEVGYFLKINEERQYYFDLDGIREHIASLKGKSVVFGFTYILYSEVVRPLYEQGICFKLPEGSKVIHIGGWKKLEAEKITKEEFNEKVSEVFGIDPLDVVDIYGFTEQMGLNYPECKCGCKHASLYSEVFVRDVVTKEVLSSGKEGLLEFLTPIPHSYPGNVVLTDDMGVIEAGECPYGRPGKRFRMTGRLKKAEVRGCGDILSSKLKFADVQKEGEAGKKSIFELKYFHDKDSMSGKTPAEILEAVEEELRKKQEWLRKQPVDALIGLIAQAAKKWNTKDMEDEKLRALEMNGLGFLSSWCTEWHLSRMADEGLRGNRRYSDAFIPVSEDGVQLRRAVPRGLACHWLAGNVQVLGMFVLIESILAKNANLLKLSSRDDGVFEALLSAFEGEVFTTKGGYSISGDELLKTIALVYYGHADKEIGKKMSLMADMRIAWGGREAVETVASYPAKYDCQDMIMGPKLSFSVISREFLSDEHKAKKLARKTAVDASVFDQTGCASTHNVFVEKGGKVTPAEFARYLAVGMEKAARQIPKGDMSSEMISAIHSVRGVYDFKGSVYGDGNNIWTVLYDEDVELKAPVYSRVLFVHPVDDIEEVLPFINENIQTIGMAAEGEKALRFAMAASDAGVSRLPACGRMLNFDSPWDGMYLFDRMVRWVTVGGPLV